ncbi:hypothetical protein TNCT_485811 [Trichonephila clavata]|uniref:MADF domain-containing protein n=1 Tax=Trichonephila clavata TaxID=2740835 RepID=A0A8X6I354_TRICU|nr:hypothetical protein TNCT_485811 [Trichonephila clavata]
MRMRERWPALESFLTPEVCIAKFQNLRTYYRKEKKKLTSFKSGTGVVDFVPKWEHFTRLQFLEDTINPVDSTSNLDYMELEINAYLRIYLIEAVLDTPPSIPSGSKSTGSELPQGERVYACTPKVKRRKSDAQEQFHSRMQTCLESRGKKTVNENFATYMASELDSLPCPKRQAVIRAKLRNVLDECIAE